MNYLTANWQAPPNVYAISTYRTGGVSLGAYRSFNLATHVGDELAAVQQNRQRLKTSLALPSEPFWLTQTHSAQAVRAQLGVTSVSADASYSKQAGIVCAVLTADCLPVLLCSTDGLQIAAIHAGWRGLALGIISNTIAQLRADNPACQLIAWLGPAIGSQAFEIGAEVRAAFIDQRAAAASAFTPSQNGKWLADIYSLARLELTEQGIDAVYGGGWCSVSDAERFYSYRRDNLTGRMASLIWRS